MKKFKLYQPTSTPRVLILDIETSPLLSYCWSIWEQNIGLNQIKEDWYVMCWAAKWLGAPESETMVMSQRNAKNMEDDKDILREVWRLIDACDILITQNGVHFDVKKLNARFLMNGFQPPSAFKNIDTKLMACRNFGLTSNKLEYMTDKLCTKYKKLKHEKFIGFDLWTECLKGNKKAWDEMEHYNKYDVLSTEELYTKLAPWGQNIDFTLYQDEDVGMTCSCGCKEFIKSGFHYTGAGKFQRHKCKSCGRTIRDKDNLLSKEKRQSLKPSA